MDMVTIKKEIDKLRKLKRNHAPYFNWHDKKVQEIAIGLNFFKKLEEESDEYLINIENVEDPPDVKITTTKNRTIGVEITELVDQKAIEYKIKGDKRYCEKIVSWDKRKTINAIKSIISTKDSKCKKAKKKYEHLFLLIFTNEPKLNSDILVQYTNGYSWPEHKNIDRVYILTGYEPKYGTKCLIRLI